MYNTEIKVLGSPAVHQSCCARSQSAAVPLLVPDGHQSAEFHNLRLFYDRFKHESSRIDIELACRVLQPVVVFVIARDEQYFKSCEMLWIHTELLVMVPDYRVLPGICRVFPRPGHVFLARA